MNVELLKKVQSYILEEPSRFSLEYWGISIDPRMYTKLSPDELDLDDKQATLARQRPPCGAIGCIAGNACIVSGIINPKLHINGTEIYEFPANTLELAAKEIGIDKKEAMRLFYLSDWIHKDEDGNTLGWPEEFEEELSLYESGTKEYAEVTVRRIEHFISTKGAE